MSPEDLLLLLAAEANHRGLLVPEIRSEQSRHSAERLLRVVGITPAAPPRALGPGLSDSRTQYLPLYPNYDVGRAPAHRKEKST